MVWKTFSLLSIEIFRVNVISSRRSLTETHSEEREREYIEKRKKERKLKQLYPLFNRINGGSGRCCHFSHTSSRDYGRSRFKASIKMNQLQVDVSISSNNYSNQRRRIVLREDSAKYKFIKNVLIAKASNIKYRTFILLLLFEQFRT